jgi:hypothetical protein
MNPPPPLKPPKPPKPLPVVVLALVVAELV